VGGADVDDCGAGGATGFCGGGAGEPNAVVATRGVGAGWGAPGISGTSERPSGRNVGRESGGGAGGLNFEPDDIGRAILSHKGGGDATSASPLLHDSKKWISWSIAASMGWGTARSGAETNGAIIGCDQREMSLRTASRPWDAGSQT
jgi:hypothetical protein